MRRTVEASLSTRSTVLSCGFVLAVSLVSVRLIVPSVPATLAISADPMMPGTIRLDEDVIEIELEAIDGPANYLLVLGSLGDAAEVSTVQISSCSSSNHGFEIPLNRTPGRPIHSPRSTLKRTTQSVSKIPEVVKFSTMPASRRAFFLQLGADPYAEASYQPVETRLLGRSAHISLWQDTADQSEKTPADVSWMADCLEQIVLPKLSRLFGPITDLDGDGTLAICLTRRLAQLPATGVPVEGLAQFNDFQPDLERPFGNQADVLFVSADLAPGPHATAILAHEAAHLAVFSRRREADPRQLEPDDDWLNEGLAHYAETVCGGDWSNLAPRIAAFQQRPALAALVVPDAARQGLWRDPAARGAAWAFMSWLAEEFGEGLLLQLASQEGSGCEKIANITGQPFEELFRQWTLAMCDPAMRMATHHLVTNETVPLRGTGHAGYQINVARGERRRIVVAATKEARVQVTVVDRSSISPCYWPAR